MKRRIAALAVCIGLVGTGCSSGKDDSSAKPTTPAKTTTTMAPARVVTPITGVLGDHTINGKALPCEAQPDGVRVCQDETGLEGDDLRLKSFDGSPLVMFVTLPPEPKDGSDGHFPLVVQSHGWGAPAEGPEDPQYGGPTALEWAKDGYAVLQLTARGWGDSCGSAASREVDPKVCEKGYTHINDYRFEARDVQHAVGLLVDEGIADPDKVGVTGDSLGAGVSLELATLNDRVMNADGSLSPWTSPDGRPVHIAAAAPFAGWSDLVGALMPNGRTLDSRETSTTADLSPIGVQKKAIANGLYTVGTMQAFYPPAGTDPDADIVNWIETINAGEPYEGPEMDDIIEQFAHFRSPYYLLAGAYGMDQSTPPSLFITSGFTDDVFPADEAVRYYDLARSLYPDLDISMFFADIGHPRAENKDVESELLPQKIEEFFDHQLQGEGEGHEGVTVLTQLCPNTDPSEGPYQAKTWDALSLGQVSFESKPEQTILSTGGNPEIAAKFETISGGLACTTTPADNQGSGIASYPLPAASGKGYTLLGSPLVSADLQVTGEHSYIAARLLDVDPATNTQRLVARGLFRIDPEDPDGSVEFQLHPSAYRFADGHIATLQLLGQDAPYSRPSNGEFSIAVTNLKLVLPVHEAPGEPGTSPAVTEP